MQRSQRLSSRPQFSAVYRDGIRIDTISFRVVYRKNRLSQSRFATVVNRKFGTAVRRNQVKRNARSLFDQVHKKISPACDLLVFPKSTMLTRRYDSLIGDFERALEAAGLLKGEL